MRKSGILVGLLLTLSACGDPLANMARISEVDLAENDATAQALPSEDEIAREGFFGTDAAQGATDTNFAPPQAAVAQPGRRGGLLALLRRAVPAPITAETDGGIDDAVTAAVTEASSQANAPTKDAPVELASLVPTPEPAVERRGLFGRLSGNKAKPKTRNGVEGEDVPYGTVLPYGAVARVCAARHKPLGRKIENASARGYKLYDSDPDASGKRTFYITGFADTCPRQLTAAHVLLGEPSFYEQLHYGPAGQHLALGLTDSVYEKVKGRVCGVRKGKPCGAKMKQLERGTFFVNSYERMDDNTRWSELLVHDGVVVASALKAN